MVKTHVQGSNEQLVAHAPVEAFDLPVLHRLAWAMCAPPPQSPAPGERVIRRQIGEIAQVLRELHLRQC